MVRPESKLLDYLNPKESVFLLNISIFITPRENLDKVGQASLV